MKLPKAYDEIVDFIAAGSTSPSVSNFHPSDEAKARVFDLLERNKCNSLSAAEALELEHYRQLEHLMRLAKARARQNIAASHEE